MIQWKRRWNQLIRAAVVLAMLASFFLSPLEAKADYSAGQSYAGEANAMTDEQYAEFGLMNNSPEEFDPKDTSNPMEGYEPGVLSELYIGQMDRNDKWKGSAMVLNNTTEISKDAFNVDHMAKDTIGSEMDFNEFYAGNKDKKEVQTHNACAIDYDNDGTDEILDITLYVDKEFTSDPKKRSCADIRVYDLVETKTKDPLTGMEMTLSGWKVTGSLKYELVDKNSDDSCFVDAIEADASKGLAVVAAGDYDGDGREEGAVYIPSQIGNNAYIAILKMGEDCQLRETGRIHVDKLNGANNTFNFRYKSWKMPIVSLATTKIAGEDDLVINISHPLKSNDNYASQGQCSSIGIFHYNGSQMVSRYLDPEMKRGDSRMRFCSAVDADLNGNGVEELVVGGYKNKDWSKDTDVGNLASDKNLIQLICWNQDKKVYEKVWDGPKEVEAHGGLKTSLEMTEPAALTAGTLTANGTEEQVFLEGNVLKFNSSSSSGTNEKALLQGGNFTKTHSMELGGSHNAFISTAYAAKFSTAGGTSEQIVVLSGDHQSTNDDYIYYDICWLWEANGAIKSEVVNNDYINHKNEDDNGTFISLCPLDADQDKIYMDYRKKTYGWSKPVLYSVLQSPPYWSELTYNSETFGAGKVSYKVSYGSGSGTDGDWGVGLGVHMELSIMAGGGLLGNNMMAGGGTEIAAMGKYVGSYGQSHSISDSYEIAVPPGEDQAVMAAVPVVTYHYDLWVPEFTVTQDDIDSYNELRKTAPENYPEAYTVYTLNKETGEVDGGTVYKKGDVVPGHWEDSRVVSTLAPSFSHIPLEKYNELAEKYADKGFHPVDDAYFNRKKIGDPASYPHSKEELYNPQNIGDVHISKQTASVTIGEGEHTLSYETEDETELSNGFNLEFEVGAYLKAKAEVSFVCSGEGEFELGSEWAFEGGASWISTNSKGVEYSASVIDLASNATDDYKFNVQMAIFDAKDLPRGDGSSDAAPVVGYLVTGIDEGTAPPMLPVDLRLFGTTKTQAVLKWEPVTGDRSAQSYEIYEKDNLGNAQVIGNTEDTYFVAKGLQPGTEYQFAVRAYDDVIRDGKNTGRASCLSRWVKAVTKEDSKTAPYFTRQPENLVVTLGGSTGGDGRPYTLSAKAEPGEEGAYLSYQWQKYEPAILTQEGAWIDVGPGTACEDGSTEYTLEINDENRSSFPEYYRVIATQTSGSVVKSVESKLATVCVNENGSGYESIAMNLSMESGDIVYKQEETENQEDPKVYYMNCGEADAVFQIDIEPDQGGHIPESGEIQLMYHDGNMMKLFRQGKGSISDEKAVIPLSGGIEMGTYRVFAVYPGSTDAVGDPMKFLAALSNPIEIRVIDTYHMKYDLNDGMCPASNPTAFAYEGEPVTVTVNDPVRQGYHFEGWYSDKSLTTRLTEATFGENDRDIWIEDPVAADLDETGSTDHTVDLYANWTAVEYAIHYELNGGENSPVNPTVYTIESPRIVLEAPTRPGYVFCGWYGDSGLTQQISSVAGGNTGDVTVYAKWEEEPAPFPQEEDGTYKISSYEDLVNMAQKIQSDPNKYASANYVQTQNINCEEKGWELPIGTIDQPFMGTYQGNDYYVLGLRQGSTQTGGLFGVIGTEGKVYNLSVVDFDYKEWTDIAGGIAGMNQGLIDGCGSGVNINSAATIFRDGKAVPITTLNSDVKGISCTGGIAGKNDGIIRNSHSNATVVGRNTGGIAGENTGNIYNIYNTGSVKGLETAGGIVGKNDGAGRIWYGYNSKVISVNEGGLIGGIAGMSENTDIGYLWYPSDMAQACGNQPDEVLTSVGKRTDTEMADGSLADLLNGAIQNEKDALGLRNWSFSVSKNGGYPTIEYMPIEQSSTLTLSVPEFGLHISVSGKIHPGAQLKFVKLSEDHVDYRAMQEAVKSKGYKEGWQLALLYEDGSYATWNGELTVRIRAENQELLKNLSVLHRDKQGAYSELVVTNQGEGIEFTTDSPENIGLMMKREGEEESGNTYPEGGNQNAGDTGENPGNATPDKKKADTKAVETGDSEQPMTVLFCLMASGILVLLIGRRKVAKGL